MDAGVSELEFSTLRSMRSLPVIPDERTEEITADQARSRQVSAQQAANKSSASLNGTGTSASALPLEVLIAPPKPKSDLELDSACHVHLQTLIQQSVENVGLQDRSWEDLLAPLPGEILALINDEVIQQLSRTKRALAQAEVQLEIARAEVKAQDAKSSKTTKKDKQEKVSGDSKRSEESEKIDSEKGKKQELDALLDLHETARHILLEDLAQQRASEDVVQEGEKTPTLEGLPKLTKFLICVSEDVGSTRRIVFDANAYTGAPLFQNDDEDAEEGSDKTIINEEVWHYVGGTIHLKAPEREWNRIEKILTLIVYAACHLKLEMHLLRDSGCSRPPPLPVKEPMKKPHAHREASDSTIHAPLSPPSSPEAEASSQPLQAESVPLSPITSHSSEDSKPATKSHGKKWSRSGLVSLLFRDRSPSEPVNKLKKRLGGRLKMHRTRSITRKSEDIARSSTYPLSPREEPLRMPGAFAVDEWELVAPEKKVVVNMARTEEEQAGETLTAPASPTGSEPRGLPGLPESALENAVAQTEEADKPYERFKRVIDRMQKAILSVSPDVHFPPPSLLQALRDQEVQLQSTEVTRIPGRPLLGRLHSYAGLRSPSKTPVASDGLPSSWSVPALLASEPGSAPTPTTAATKISIDTRAGLASLMTGNNSLDGTLRHQSIPCLFEKLARDPTTTAGLCQPPLWRKLVYYDYEAMRNPWTLSTSPASSTSVNIGDLSLSDFCSLLAKAEGSECSAHCGRKWQDHIFSLIHMNRKVTFTVKESLLASSVPERMLHWVVCSLCGKRSDTVGMSDASLAVSFGKYVELLLYDNAFHPPKEEFCPHADDPFSMVRTFLRNGAEIRVKQEAVILYTLRMPTSVDATVSPELNEQIHLDHSLDVCKLTLKEEIRAFFASVKDSRSKLSNPFSAEAEGPKPDVESLLERIDIAELDREEEDLVHAVETATLEDINRLRLQLAHICREYCTIFDDFAKSKDALTNKDLPAVELEKPVYMKREDTHVVPAENHVLLREDEMSSFIAYTLSAGQYHAVSATKSNATTPEPLSNHEGSTASPTPLPHSEPPSAVPSRIPTPTDRPTEDKRSRKGGQPEWELSAKVKKTVKPSGSILSLKATTPRGRLQDIFSLGESGKSSRQASPAPESRTTSKIEEDDKVLEALLSATKATVQKPSPLGPTRSPALPSLISSLVSRRHVSEATATSALSDSTATSSPSALDISVQHGRAESVRSVSTVDSEASTESHLSDVSNNTLRGQEGGELDAIGQLSQPSSAQQPVAAKGSAFSTISGFLNRGLRINHLESSETPAIRDSSTGPHVKLTFRHEHKKMSCIVYYAQEFAALRKACGLPESLYVKSLERSHALQFSGGKTSAGFWLTEDERLVLKEMRTSWNVSEVDAMLTFAPNYLNYLMNSNRPSLLTKIFGMYTCKIKNLKTGEKQKVDYVVMEHLFFDQQVTTKFDLKGISTRVARAKGEGQTLWDADWVENFQTRLLVHAHHKTILREAIAADTEFLQQNNVMDYSALVGVDDKNHTLTIGLIDTLGIFNLAKTIESNSKRVLQAERTIIPPDEYAARFQKALDEYIIASPEKFSKSPGDDAVPALHCPL